MRENREMRQLGREDGTRGINAECAEAAEKRRGKSGPRMDTNQNEYESIRGDSDGLRRFDDPKRCQVDRTTEETSRPAANRVQSGPNRREERRHVRYVEGQGVVCGNSSGVTG
jgi:hypothetical protein